MWVALPDDHRLVAPSFDHYASLPVLEIGSARMTVIIGEVIGHKSPAKSFSPIVGAELLFDEDQHADQHVDLPLAPGFEHAVFVLSGNASLNGMPIAPNALH